MKCGRHRIQFVVLSLVWIILGCGNSNNPGAVELPESVVASDDSGATSRAMSDIVRGKVAMANGSPISIPEAQVSLILIGVPDQPGDNVQLSPTVKADGTYEQQLRPGQYHFADAMIELPYMGENYRLDLDPVGNMHAPRPSAAGISQDFVWRISGQRPGTKGDLEQPMHWYGGHLSIQYAIYREDVKRAIGLPETGTKFKFELTPQGPLIDGTVGKTLVFDREWTADMSVTSSLAIPDVPIGAYTLTGEIMKPDGTKKQAVFDVSFAKFSTEVEIRFPPRRLTNSVETRLLSVGEVLDE